MDNKDIIVAAYSKHIGSLMLDMFTVVRLVGLDFSTYDDDYYYVIDEVGGRRLLLSCVAHLIPLKNNISDTEYSMLEKCFSLNYSEIS